MTDRTLFLDFHTQRDFFPPKGRLPFEEAGEIRPRLRLLTHHAIVTKSFLVAFVETHSACHHAMSPSLKKTVDFCLEGSRGSEKIPETSVPDSYFVHELKMRNSLSSFFKKKSQLILPTTHFNAFEKPALLNVLKKSGITKVVLFGIGLEYGIEMAALQLLKAGFSVYIPVDAVACINPANREPVLKELHKAGVHIWNTEFLITPVVPG